MKLDTREFNKSLNNLIKESSKDDFDILTFNGKQVIRLIAYETPKKSGFGRAGWTASWNEIGNPGKPYTRKAPGKHKRGKKTYIVSGKMIDNRKDRVNPSVEFVNNTFLLYERGNFKLKLNYLFDLNDGKLRTIQGEAVGKDNKGFVQKAVNRATFKFKNNYKRRLKKFSGK